MKKQIALAIILALSAGTIALAETAEEQQACTNDAFRLCSAEIPDVDRVTACMVRNQSQLSPGCRVFFRPSEDERAGAPVSLRPVTEHRPAHKWHRVKKAKPAAT